MLAASRESSNVQIDVQRDDGSGVPTCVEALTSFHGLQMLKVRAIQNVLDSRATTYDCLGVVHKEEEIGSFRQQSQESRARRPKIKCGVMNRALRTRRVRTYLALRC